jgi:beta-galactosidase
VDNIWITVKRSADYHKRVVPLLNIGALVKYRMGKGGVVLNQLRVVPSESNPVNGPKRRAVASALLRNLGATFAAERLVVVGPNLKYTPIPLAEKCNQFLTSDRGWLAGQPDLRHFPVGEQKLAGVRYLIRDFKTSPLPACVMLAGPGAKGNLPQAVEGIPVGRKADTLFFLHTFHRVKEWRPEQNKGKQEPPAVFVYVVTYADGKKIEIPVRYERGVGHWIAEEPKGVPEAAVAWAAPFPGDPKRQAVIYQMAWANPRPGEEIASLAVRYDARVGNQYGVPALFAVTAATAQR